MRIAIIISLFFFTEIFAQKKYVKPEFAKSWSNPSKHPDHIILNFSGDPSKTISATWRTSKDVKE